MVDTDAGDTSADLFPLTRRKLLTGGLAACALSAIPPWAAADSSVSLSLGPPAEHPVPLDYLGFSYETVQLADPTFFAPDNHQLIALFRALSPSGILRIGGNSSEFCWWKTSGSQTPPQPPGHAGDSSNWMPQRFTAIGPDAIDRLAGFLEATGWHAIYGLNLGTGTPDGDAAEAEYVAKALGPRLLFFQIGNEPEFYRDPNNRLRSPDWNFDRYLAQWLTFARAVTARVPAARFGGPDVGSSADWVIRFAQEAPKALPGRIAACSGHYYAEGPPDDPRVTMQRLLAPDPHVTTTVPRMVEAAASAGIVYRMTEGNSCYRGGKPGMSNAFGSALWSADYLLTLASYGTVGVNLHGGGSQQIRLSLGGHLPGETLSPEAAAIAAEGSFYTPIAGSRQTGFTARPVLYGMKLAGVMAGCRMRPAHLPVDPARATAYGGDSAHGTRLVLIHKDASRPLRLTIPSAAGAKLWRLEAPALTAISGVTLAGARLTPDPWKPLSIESIPARQGSLTIDLPPASAAALFIDQRLA